MVRASCLSYVIGRSQSSTVYNSFRKEADKSGPKIARWRKRVGCLGTINRRFTFCILTGHEKSLGTRVEVLGR